MPDINLWRECNSMPFLFKLAKRMARLRARAVLLATAIVLAACDSPDQALSGPTPTRPSFATATGLPAATSYDFALVSYRGTLMVNAVFGPLSNFASGTARTPAPTVPTAPGTVTDLAVAAATDTVITLSFTEVTDGSGQAAKYDIRYAP